MTETILDPEKLTASRKARALRHDRARGLILDKPLCEACGWVGEKAAVYGAGCPQCGERITADAEGKKKGKGASSQEGDAA